MNAIITPSSPSATAAAPKSPSPTVTTSTAQASSAPPSASIPCPTSSQKQSCKYHPDVVYLPPGLNSFGDAQWCPDAV